jgi:DNA-binding transcriptional regulator YhcF (GntR family)
MVGREVVEQLFDKKLLAILRVFLDNPEKQYYLRELAKLTKVPPATTLRALRRLKKCEVVDEIRVKKFKLYQIKAEGETVRFLEEFLATKKSALDEFIRLSRSIVGVEMILLHGKETPEKANLLMLGRGIDAESVHRIVVEIKNRYHYTILQLILEPEQFEQMTQMGLYQGKKTVLFRRQNMDV